MKGILMTPANHLATREKRKVQTRRLDNLHGINQHPDNWHIESDSEWEYILCDSTTGERLPVNDYQLGTPYSLLSRYRVGETVYLKEVWATIKDNDNLSPSEISESSAIFYKFGDNRCGDDPDELNMERGKWRSPLFLPEVFARDFVKIKGLGIQRLQDITREDIRKEGVILPVSPRFTPNERFSELHQEFADLWDSINGKRVRSKEYTSTYDWARGGIERKHYTYLPSPYCWDANPWAWVYSYELLEGKP